MSTPVRAVLFDKDGTLIDFDRTWRRAYTEAAETLVRTFASPVTASRLLEVGGLAADGRWQPGSVLASGSNAQIAAHWAAALGIADANAIQDIIEPRFHATVCAQPIPVTDLRRLFAELLDMGLALGVATMDSEQTARATLASLGVMDRLSFLCGADSGFGVKPAPGMVHGFSDAVGVPADQIVVVGDSPHDLNMARAAKARAGIAVLGGAHRAEHLALLAEHVLEDISGLPLLLRGHFQ